MPRPSSSVDHPGPFPRVLTMIGLVVLGVFVGQVVVNRIEAARAQTATVPREVTERGPLPAGEQQTIDLFHTASPSVVYITTLQRFTNRITMDVTDVPAGTGSGFIWDDLGHIVTNYHVIAQRGARYSITLYDQTTYAAELIGIAPNNDLAVLKINAPAEKLKSLAVGTSHDLRVGQSVLAIGNPFGLDQTLTTGIVSALGRTIRAPSGLPIDDVVQTDAAINPGNSGGPLLDSSGRLIGVNTQIASPNGVAGSVGIGFAIPVDTVNRIVPSMIRNHRPGKPGTPTRAVLGLREMYVLNPAVTQSWGLAGGGVAVVSVDPDGGAAAAGIIDATRADEGITNFDVITEIAGRKINSPADIMIALSRFDPGQEVVVKVWRKGAEREVKVKLGSSE